MKAIDRDFVTAVYIVKDRKVLLVFHKKLQKWIPPGGHIDRNELPDDAAIREVREETGLDIELLGERMKSFHGIQGLVKPELIQLEDIREGHQHINLIYAARLLSEEITQNLREVDDIGWFSPDEPVLIDNVRHSARMVIERYG